MKSSLNFFRKAKQSGRASSKMEPSMNKDEASAAGVAKADAKKTVKQMADKFDYWMKTYNQPKEPDTARLVAWLSADRGARDVKDYAQFCELAMELNTKGYITLPAPSPSEFDKGVEKNSQKEKFEKELFFKPTHSRGKLLQSASTVALLDAIEGYSRPGGARDIYEADTVRLDRLFEP